MSKTDVTFPTIPDMGISAPSVQNQSILPRQIFASGTLPGNTVIRIGDDNIIIDGENNRIIVNDGTDDRVIIGKL